MRSRTCPNCRYRYTIKDLLKKPIYALEWNCRNCGEKLTTSTPGKIFLAILGVVPAAAFPHLAKFLSFYFSIVFSWVSAFVILLLWFIFIFSFNKFSIANAIQKKSA